MSEYEMVMPFVTVTSKGGPHDDDSYVAGYQMGLLDAQMLIAATSKMSFQRDVSKANQPQADLIAMRHGYDSTVHELGDEFPQWVLMEFRPGVAV